MGGVSLKCHNLAFRATLIFTAVNFWTSVSTARKMRVGCQGGNIFLFLEPRKVQPQMQLGGNHCSKRTSDGVLMEPPVCGMPSSRTASGDTPCLRYEFLNKSALYACNTAMVCATSLAHHRVCFAHQPHCKPAWHRGQD